MKTFILFLSSGLWPLFMLSQTLPSGVTLSPDSLWFDTYYTQTTTLSNETGQPVNITSVQMNCSGCHGWTWVVDSMSFNPPHYIYPGQTESITIRVYGSIMEHSVDGYLHSTMEIAGSGGLQQCHIFMNQNLITSAGGPVENLTRLFPDPVTSILTIEVPLNSGEPGSVEIYGPAGQVLMKKAIDGGKVTLDAGSLAGGMYLVKVQAGSQCSVRRFIKL